MPLLREKRGVHSREALVKYFTSKREYQFEGDALASTRALSSKYSICSTRRKEWKNIGTLQHHSRLARMPPMACDLENSFKTTVSNKIFRNYRWSHCWFSMSFAKICEQLSWLLFLREYISNTSLQTKNTLLDFCTDKTRLSSVLASKIFQKGCDSL